MTKKITLFSSFILLLFLISSCSRFKDITYLRGIGYGTSSDSLIKTTYNLYKIQPFDILYIHVSSLDDETSNMFNRSMQASTGGNTAMMGANLIGYTVDLYGFIELPVIGKMQVAGLTLYDIENQVKEKIKKYLADAQVMVRLLSFKITLLGEIGNGQKTISSDRANLLEVFAMGGDISKYGNRHKILLLRTTPEGIKTYRIDVTKDDLISSPFFYVQPNDLIYVEPVKSAAFRLMLSDYALILTTITTTISTYFLIYSITK